MRFSVVIPCFNKGAFLGETLDCLARQARPADEVIVVDDGSTDPFTRERLRELCADYSTRLPIQLIEQPNAGPSAARNTGIARATGDWILPLDADDLLTPDALERYARAIEREPEVDIWYPDIIHFGTEENVWWAEEFNPSRLLRENLMVSSAAIRRRLFDEGLHYNERIRIGFEDWEFYIHAVCERGAIARPLRAAVFCYRRWGYSRYDLSCERDTAARQQIREERPIYRDFERRLELKQRYSPAFVIAADGPELRRALDAQTWRDVQVADETGLVRRQGDLSLFQRHPGRLLLASLHDRALARALEQDRRLLEKIELTMRVDRPPLLWLAVLNRPAGVFPGAPLDESEVSRARAVGVVTALETWLAAPAVAIPRTDAGLWSDLARAFAEQPGSHALIVAGADRDEEAPPLAGFLTHAPRKREPKPSSASSPQSSPSFGDDEPRTLREELIERAWFAGKSLGMVARAAVGPSRYERWWRAETIARVRKALKARGAAAPTARAPIARPGPVVANLRDRERRNLADIATDEPLRPAPDKDDAGGLLIVTGAVGVEAAGESVVELVDALAAQAPELRLFVIATGEAAMAGAERVIPRVAGFFHVPRGRDERGDAAAAEIARLAQSLDVAALLVADSRAGYDAIPLARQAAHPMRVVSQLFDFYAPTGKWGGFPVYAASRCDALIDTYVVGTPAFAEQLVETGYVSPSKIRVIRRGADRERWARELGAVLLPGRVGTPRQSVG